MTKELLDPIDNWHEQYCGGGYHPVHMGDGIRSGRYRIVHKLGYGSYSTVWLTRYQQQDRFVSLKSLVADASRESPESRVLRYLEQHPNLQRSRKWFSRFPVRDNLKCPFVLTLLDEFEIRGPSGNHRCIVTDVLGPSVPAVKSY